MGEIATLRDERIGLGASCASCRHAFPIKISLKDTVLDCRAMPPQSAYALTSQGLQLAPQLVPRFVPADYFCGYWQPENSALS